MIDFTYFRPRYNEPVNNKYYTRKDSGGYSPCIQGKPLSENGCDVLGNCVGYAVGRFNEIIGDENCDKLGSYDAGYLIDVANEQKLTVSDMPTLGGAMVWQRPDKPTKGHVAIVEAIHDENTVTISESGYNSYIFRTRTIKKVNGKWDLSANYVYAGCIVNPSVTTNKQYTTGFYPILRRKDTGVFVWFLQKLLNIYGLSVVTDGVFGAETEKAVRTVQEKNRLTADGVAGFQTWYCLIGACDRVRA